MFHSDATVSTKRAGRPAIEAILWDYGGVFLESPFGAAVELARGLGVASARYFELLFGPYHLDTDHPWHRLERGELSFELARDAIIELGASDGIDCDPLHFFAAIKSKSAPRTEVIECARSLMQRGYRSALVTNNVAEYREAWKATLPLAELFHEVIDSSEVGVRKPNPRIFELALEQLGGIEPSRAVFLDDFAGNVAAARAMGIHGILVGSDWGEAQKELEGLLAAG